jgi:hypothetical protein
LEFQVLRLGGDTGTGKYLVAITQARSEMQGDTIQQTVIITYHHILVNDTERTDYIIVAQDSFRINNS